MRRIRRKLEEENEAIADLEDLHGEVAKYWSNIKLQRNIGHVEYAPAIKVDEGRTRYTADWAVFLAAEAKVKDAFEGNVVDLGAFRFIFLAFASSDEITVFRIQVFSPTAHGYVLSSWGWSDQVQVSRREEA